MSGNRLCFSAIQRRCATFSVLTQAVCRRFKESILILSVPILLSSLKTQKPLLVWSTTKYTGSIHARFIKTQAARILAMQMANDNAVKLLGKLQLEYNKLRQQGITSELLDIAGGSNRES